MGGNGSGDGGNGCADKIQFHVGDKIIQTKNDYKLGDGGLFNGTIGYVLEKHSKNKSMTVEWDDGQTLEIPQAKFDNIDLAYALTTHKAQGSEFPCALVVCHSKHFVMLNRNWLYTAVTRAKERVIIVGNNKGVKQALNNSDAGKRRTFLSLVLAN